MSYLSRRDGRYHYRRRFPADVALIVGRAEFRKALGTADRAEALRLARQVSVEFDKICAQAVQGHCGDVRPIGDELPGVDANAVLSGLQAVVERVTLAAVQAMHPRGQRLAKSWQAELEWQERAWQAGLQMVRILTQLNTTRWKLWPHSRQYAQCVTARLCH
ncbi:DUF6538 domain-containing protein [Pseudomonas syringae group genomosp. 7]|uniref:DUF6538 domain-containing protein n=1 Tax=Pseudomonas syringae group genomosp. 7 TaxID=251699 RepID=UPI0030C718F5